VGLTNFGGEEIKEEEEPQQTLADDIQFSNRVAQES